MSEEEVIHFFLFHSGYFTNDESLCFWCYQNIKPYAQKESITFFIAGCRALRLELVLLLELHLTEYNKDLMSCICQVIITIFVQGGFEQPKVLPLDYKTLTSTAGFMILYY